MTAVAIGCLLVALVLAADRIGRRLPGRWSRLPLLALCAGLAAVAVELTCYDHGHGDVVTAIAFIGAPVVVIFCGALAAARRWYGYPDLGPLPGRLALVGAAILAGVLAGAPLRARQIEDSMRLGETIARSDDLVALDVETKLGFVAPPRFSWDRDRRTLSFPISTTSTLALDAAALRQSPGEKPRWKRVDP